MAEDTDNPNAPTPRPYWRRSVLWDYEDAIRKRIDEKKSYPQILDALRRLGLRQPIGARRLAQFCVEQLGIHSLRPSRHDRNRPGTDKTPTQAAAAAQSARLAAAPPPPPQAPPPTNTNRAISDALGPEPGDPWAEFRKPETSSSED